MDERSIFTPSEQIECSWLLSEGGGGAAWRMIQSGIERAEIQRADSNPFPKFRLFRFRRRR